MRIAIILFSFCLNLTCWTQEPSLDSLIVNHFPQEIFSSHLDGAMIHYFEDSLFLVDFSSGEIHSTWGMHGIELPRPLKKEEKIGLDGAYCHQVNIQDDGQAYTLSFSFGGDHKAYFATWNQDTTELTSTPDQMASVYPFHVWSDKVISFESGYNHQMRIHERSTSKLVYQTTLNKMIDHPATNGVYNVEGDLAYYIVKESGNAQTVFCKVDLANLKHEYKKINLPPFTAGGSFNRVLIDGNDLYLFYTGSELSMSDPDFYAKSKRYLLHVNFETEEARSLLISDLLEKVSKEGNERIRVQKEGKELFLCFSRQDDRGRDPKKRFLNQIFKIDLEKMEASKLIENQTEFITDIMVYDGTYMVRERAIIWLPDDNRTPNTKFSLYTLPKK